MEAEERVEQAVAIVAAYVAHNSVPAAEMPGLIAAVHAALSGLGQAPAPEEPPAPKLAAGQIRRSITPKALISFEDGKPYKTLRHHLAGKGLTPGAYRAKWGLPTDYPMVVASYLNWRACSRGRSNLPAERSMTHLGRILTLLGLLPDETSANTFSCRPEPNT